MSQRVLTAHVPKELARDVDHLAEKLDRPRGWVMKEALALYVGLERKRHALTLEALADVDAQRTIDHTEVEAWAAALPSRKRRRRR
jgi:predicted transcriptional regulator